MVGFDAYTKLVVEARAVAALEWEHVGKSAALLLVPPRHRG